jgi:flavorubredoxin
MRNDYDHTIISEVRASYLIKHYGVKGHLHMVSPENPNFTTKDGRKIEFLMTLCSRCNYDMIKSILILQHQDPDLCAGVPIFEDMRNDYDHTIISEVRASYLIKHYGVKGHLHMVSPENPNFTTKDGRKIEFLMTPFAHFAGAIMTYDPKSKVLFTSDVLGGLGKDWELYHNDTALANMKKFLSLYMPSNKALRYALLKILSVDADIIAPQHGQIIRKNQLDGIVNSLWDLKCGLDLVDDEFMAKAIQGKR